MSSNTSQSSSALPRWRRAADFLSTVVSVAAGSAVIFVLATDRPALETKRPSRPEPTVPTQPVSVDGATRIGAATAKVALIQYLDFECPYCKKFAVDVLPSLRAKYVDSGRAAFFWKHLPLGNHRFAVPAAEAAVCAERFGRFAEAHDILFRSDQLSEGLLALPAALTVAAAAFDRCREEIGAPAVAKDQASTNALGIASTPSFFVGRIQENGAVRVTRALRGIREIADFEEALDSVLKRVPASANGQTVR